MCGYDGEIQIVEEDGKLVWRCPNCGNEDQSKMNVARRTCGYIGSQFWNQGRTQEIKRKSASSVMNYGAIKKCDIANGVGVRTVLFVSGCTHHCKGCFQPETWNFDYGERYTKETEDEIIESLRPDYVDGITLLGGEPFEPENQRELVKLLRRIKKRTAAKDRVELFRVHL